MRMFKSKGMMARFLLSYLCVLTPMLILSLWMVNTMRAGRVAQLRSQVSMRVENALARLDEQVEQYRESAIVLANEPEFLRYKMLESEQNAREGIVRLREVLGYHPELWEIFLVYDAQRVYSNRGMSSADTFFADTLKLDEDLAERTRAAVRQDESCVLRLNRMGAEALYLYHFPVRIYSNNVVVSVNFLLNVSNLLHAVATTVADPTARILLAPRSTEAETGGMEIPPGYASVSGTGGYYFLTVAYDESTLMAGDAQRWAVWYLAIAVLMLMLVLLSYHLSRRHYKPIARLVHRAQSASPGGSGIAAENEYAYIDEMILQMARESDRLNQQLAAERRVIRRQSAALIFNGLVRDAREIRSRLDLSGARLDSDTFAVFAVSAGSPETLAAIRERAADCLQCEADTPASDVLLILSGLRGEDAQGAQRMAYVQWLAGGENIRAGVSGVKEDLEQISQARLEALSAWSQAREGAPEIARDMRLEKAAQLAEAFSQSLARRDGECAIALLRQLRAEYCGAQNDENIRRILVSIALQLQNACQEEAEETENLSSLMEKVAAHGDNAWQTLEQVVRGVCARDDRSDIVAEALAYIRQEFASSDLSLDAVAEHCGVSSAYMSRLFKRRMGTGYIDYVTQLRMAEAKNLLRGTTLPVAEIATRVGYINASSFRKKFKMITGRSLSEYRQDNREDEQL